MDGPVIRVVVADDHPLVRAGLASVLNAEPDIEVAGEAATGTEAVAAVAGLHPDVLLLDLRMPELSGVEVCATVRAEHPETAVLVLTSFDDAEDVRGAFAAGASGYLLKDVRPDALVQSIRGVADGQMVLEPAVAHHLMDRESEPTEAPPLSAREREVLTLMARGMKNREIAGAMWLSESTVKTHVGNVIHKLGQHDRTQAVVYALRLGIVTLDDEA